MGSIPALCVKEATGYGKGSQPLLAGVITSYPLSGNTAPVLLVRIPGVKAWFLFRGWWFSPKSAPCDDTMREFHQYAVCLQAVRTHAVVVLLRHVVLGNSLSPAEQQILNEMVLVEQPFYYEWVVGVRIPLA